MHSPQDSDLLFWRVVLPLLLHAFSPMMVCLLQVVAQLGPTGGRWSRKQALHLPAFPYLSPSLERPGAVQGARFVRGEGKSFAGLKRFSAAPPGRRGPF